jgi:hypothetical protein
LQTVFEVLIVKKICFDTPVVQLVRCFHQGKKVGVWPSEYALEPSWESLHWLSSSAGLGINLDEVGAAARAIVHSEYGEHTFIKHFDPFGRAVESIADGHSEV